MNCANKKKRMAMGGQVKAEPPTDKKASAMGFQKRMAKGGMVGKKGKKDC